MLMFNSNIGTRSLSQFHLNTSHVNVQSFNLASSLSNLSYLNTSHVNVQSTGKFIFVPNSKGFKYISC